nr:PREDICTED: ribosome biogenesis protein WDR12 homolog [Bemisia tabaci]
MEPNEGNADDTTQLQLKFVTKQEQFAVPDTVYAVPATLHSWGLNNLINDVLKSTKADHEQVKFDFLINGELLRARLNTHFKNHELPTEAIHTVEYLEARPAPEPQDCLLHDDWVAAIHHQKNWILTGCYDNTLHIWNKKGEHKLTIPGHSGAVKAVSWITVNNDSALFASGGADQTVMLWEWNIRKNSVECVHVCRGHERSIECLTINLDATKIVSSGWDNLIKIWNAEMQSSVEGEPEKKKFKSSDKNHIRTPVMTLKGHKEAVSAIRWIAEDEIVTSSWDHTLKFWDVTLGGVKSELAGNKAFFDLDYSHLNKLIITASADRHIRLYDPRSTEGLLVKSTFTHHTQWVPCVRWSTTNEYLFVSGSYDQQVKLWDTRSPKTSLYDMTGHTDKVLSCDWSDPELILSGGADNTLRLFKFTG